MSKFVLAIHRAHWTPMFGRV